MRDRRRPYGRPGGRTLGFPAGGPPPPPALPGEASDPDADWASRREAELREQWRPEWLHNGTLEGDPETTEERNRRLARETLHESFERVPELRQLYSVDPETGEMALDPGRCEEAGEAALHGMLKSLIEARLEGAVEQDVVCVAKKTRVQMHLSREHLHVPSEDASAWRLGLAYTDPVFDTKDGVEVISRRMLLFDPASERFICQEVSRPWCGDGINRDDAADGVLQNDLRHRSFEGGFLDAMSALGLLAEARKYQPAAAEDE